MDESILKNYCNQCKNKTNHKILFVEPTKGQFPLENHRGIVELRRSFEEYHVVKCLGCDRLSFLRIIQVENIVDEYGDPSPFYFNYPNDQLNEGYSYDFLSADDMSALPVMISELYKEVAKAFNANSDILSGIGLRTLVEAVCINQKITGKNLKERIQNLHKMGLVSKKEEPILDKLRLIGNVSAHQIKSLGMEQLEHALNIVNHIIKSIYILPMLDKKIII